MKHWIKHWLATFLVVVLAGPGRAQTLQYTTSWLGNSFGGTGSMTKIAGGFDAADADNVKWVQLQIFDIWAASDGTVYTIGRWDEAHKTAGVYKNGLTQGKLQDDFHHADGGAVTGNDTYVWITTSTGDAFEGVGPSGFRRYTRSDRRRSGDEVFNISTSPLRGLATVGTELFASDHANGKIKVFNTDSHALLREWSLTDPGRMAIDGAGYLWVAQPSTRKVLRYSTTGALQSQQVTLPSGSIIADIAIDKDGRLLVADNGPDQNIKVYTGITGSPAAAASFGVKGGVYAGPTPGLVGPQRFHHLTGVGADAAGNTYVSMYGQRQDAGTELESYSATGSRNWALHCLHFVDNADADPASDGVDVYTKHEHFTMDYSQNGGGKEWTYKGFTMNPFKYPNDPRNNYEQFGHNVAGTIMRRLNGKLYMYLNGMHNQPLTMYRFDPANEGETAIPCYTHNRATGGWAQWPDRDGTIWEGGEDGIFRTPLNGFDSNGNPQYGAAVRVSDVPAPFNTANRNDIERLEYDVAADVMYVNGFTSAQPYENGGGEMGKVLARYNNWSTGNRTPAWQTVLPSDRTLGGDNIIFPKAMNVEGDYVFVISGKQMEVMVYRKTDGVYIGSMLRPSESGIAQVDIPHAITVRKRANGQYLIFVEEDWFQKVLLYRWTPGTTPTNPTPSNPPAGTLANVPNGTYTLTPECAPNARLDVSGSNTANGTKVQIYADNGGNAQKWVLTQQSDGSYRLTSKLNAGKVLDVKSSGTANGTLVQLYDWNNSNAQKWQLYDVGNGYFKLVPKSSAGKALDVAGMGSANGTQMQLWDDVGNAAQRFRLTPVETVPDGTYTLAPECAPNARLDVPSGNTANGTQLQIYTANGDNAQKWTVQKQPDGSYRLSAKLNGNKVLDVRSSGTANGTAVQLYDWNNSNAQKWTLTDAGNGYFKLAPLSSAGKVLDVAGMGSADGTKMHLWEDLSNAAQRFRFSLAEGSASSAAARTAAATSASPAAASSLSLPAESPTLSAYPNPSPDGRATLRLAARQAQTATVHVRDGRGQLVGLFSVPTKAGQTDFRLPPTLAPGTYYVHAMLDGKAQRFTFRVE
ncbi:RICIN domain-containing protein [Hymenobacter weizhouensis]|uniref:RICIN domain-containing protein n=1 Tax=Hymenobacter sp. YIM 151500-1 TaxID=2987689 RepID=UPI002227504D|nr:RICIN domain-containing protein [Hymenobacter sp. YIM 151500-1]UYZ64952.1 RICIN domain-containing protein [Hymenobacter sp. YIM 151500-1]